jgi:hypothetical protein
MKPTLRKDKPQVLSINISLPKKVLSTKGETLYSGVFINLIEGILYLDGLRLECNKVAENKNHGGPYLRLLHRSFFF